MFKIFRSSYLKLNTARTVSAALAFALVYAVAGCGTVDVPNDDASKKELNAEIEMTSYNFVPPQNQALMFIGQDSDSINDYLRDTPEDHIEGVTLYTQLKSNDLDKTFFGVTKTANWLAGDVNFEQTLSTIEADASLAVGLAYDNCNQVNHEKNIAEGHYDKTLSHMVGYFKNLAPRKVYLRMGYEFDGPWNCYTPDNYKRAFRKIALEIKAQHATNIVTVWQSAAWSDSYGNSIYDNTQAGHFDNWYPGDDVVDWVSMSVFYRDLSQWNYQPPTTPKLGQQQVVDFARRHNKPVMIAEAAPQGYRIGGLTRSVIQENASVAVTAEQIWLGWFQPFFQFIDDNRDVIKAVAYINAHWESQGMWHCEAGIAAGQPGCGNGNWGDTRVQANEEIKRLWLQEVNDPTRWVQTNQFEQR